jgi:pyruvate/2-oxoglutarate dehydrogenase complex dihydrolipoamide acyltransferase (E2) component
VWSWLAPLDAGVVATGTVKVTSNRKAVQHLTGGTVEAILVREGDLVKKGQEVVRLDACAPWPSKARSAPSTSSARPWRTAWRPSVTARTR